MSDLRFPPDTGLSGRVVWLLLRLFPSSFRAQFGAEMLAAFLDCRDRLREKRAGQRLRRSVSIARLTCTTTFGIVRAAVAERHRARRKERRAMHKSTYGVGGKVTDIWMDMRYGFRTLRRTPGFTLVAVLTLALGVGATTAMFSVLNTTLRQSLPYPEADRLVMGRATFGGRVNPWTSFPDYVDYRDQAETLESLATIGPGVGLVTITGTGEPEQARIAYSTANLFRTLGVAFQLGGPPSIEELPAAGGGEVVLSYSFWQRWFGGDIDVLGRSIDVDGNSMTIVGVLPQTFRFWYDTDLWVPPWPGNSEPVTRKYHNWLLVGRLAAGATLETARAEIDVISAQLEEAYPESNTDKALQLDSLHSAMVEGYRQSLLLLSGAIVLVLLIACGNVANLLLARGSTRVSELAVRSAMGATRSRLTHQLLVECLILALVAGGLGVMMAVWFQNLILRFVSMDQLGIEQAGLSGTMLGIALFLSISTVLLFGVFPSLAAARASSAENLKQGGRASTSGGGIRYRSVLVVLQVALSLVLLVGAGLLIKSFARLRGVEPGFRVDNMLTGSVSLPSEGYQEGDLRLQFFQGLQESIAGLPGVESVSMVSRFPIVEGGGNYAAWAAERPPATLNEAPAWPDARIISPGYFATLEIPLVDGRFLQETDAAESPPVVVLTRTAADRIFPDERAVGRQLATDSRDGPQYFEVVGVVEDHRLSSLAGAPRPAMFFPLRQRPLGRMALAVGTTMDPLSLIRPIQERIWELDRDIVLSDAKTVESALSESIAGARSVTTVLGVFATAALALAALGLYGVLAFFVSKRVHEIGIRVALGAPGTSVLRMVLARGLTLVGVGLAVGAAGALGATRLMEGMLFEVSAKDPVTFAGVTGVFVLVSLGACLIPAWKALRVDPVEVLRLE